MCLHLHFIHDNVLAHKPRKGAWPPELKDSIGQYSAPLLALDERKGLCPRPAIPGRQTSPRPTGSPSYAHLSRIRSMRLSQQYMRFYVACDVGLCHHNISVLPTTNLLLFKSL